jgi:hypothetical protein
MTPDQTPFTPREANQPSRREFLRASAALVGSAALAGTPALAALPDKPVPAPESVVKTLYNSLTEEQKRVVALPWDNARRKMVNANWAIVDKTVGETFNADQREMVKTILRGVTNEEWFPKFLAQMKHDGGGWENYHVALFGDPNTGKSEFVMTGRHMTMRAGGDPAANMAFGGPIFYGHAPKDTEDPDHPGNVFWYQGKQANKAFQMLDGKQRAKALIAVAPNESAIAFRKNRSELPGLAVGEMAKDQKAFVETVVRDLLAPYRKKDVDDALRGLKANDGMDTLHLAFYKQDDLGNDGQWDIWRLEGPGFVWHFRGAPHVHAWVNVSARG